MMTPGWWAGRLVETLPENLFREPIDFLFADHFRLRVICDRLDQLAAELDKDGTPQTARAIAGFLEQDFPLHIADEEEDLLPRLNARCEPDDNVASAFVMLADEHRKDDQLRRDLLPDLHRLAAGRPPDRTASFVRAAAVFAEAMRRHLAWEEGLILPLARNRLSAADCEAIGRRMAARRDVVYPER